MPDYKTLYQPSVPTQPGQPQPVITPNQLYSREYAQAVWIPLAQNILGGLGLGGLVLVIGLRAGGSLEGVGLWAAFAGGLVTCLATAVRAFRDEVRIVLASWGERQDRATRGAMQIEIDALRKQIKDLQSAGVISQQYRVLMTAERLLREKFEQGLDIDRREAEKRGHKREDVRAAYNLMKSAGAIDGHSQPRVATFVEAWSLVLRSQSAGQGRYAVTEAGDLVRQR